jgi:hypothetical protein
MHANTPSAEESRTFTFDDRHWRVRGLCPQRGGQRLRASVMVARGERVHLDTLDLYSARSRRAFVKEAAAELALDPGPVKTDLGRVLLALEEEQDALRREALERQQPTVPEMTAAQREEALAFLNDPRLLERILEDYEACGLVGEETGKLICYLACVSRLLPRPLSVLIQSSSAAGKTSLVEGTLRLMPPEAQVRISSLTGQSLYYMGRDQLKHKILSVAEEEGASEAAYALKLLQSEGQLSIACVGRDGGTGRPRTEHYEVEGPVAMLLTTTAEEPDEELANRCLVLSVNGQPQQTGAIHQRQRRAYTLPVSHDQIRAVTERHQHAQRVLQPLTVVMPWAERLTFRTDQVRYRRDHATYLALIASLTLLHQAQRKQVTHGQQDCVVASLDDLAMANALASEAFDLRARELLPHTRRLLAQLHTYVRERAEAEEIAWSQVRFTQREVRETLHWSDHALRRQLGRLVQLEYVVAYRAGPGNQRAYQLIYDGQLGGGSPLRLGLTDAEQLRRQDTREGSLEPPQARDSRDGPVESHPLRHPIRNPIREP